MAHLELLKTTNLTKTYGKTTVFVWGEAIKNRDPRLS